jgi:hypothetical protein
MLGDLPPFPVLIPLATSRGTGVVVLPTTRGFKIADNESPEPRDRAYFSFNGFDNLYRSVIRRAGGGVHRVQVFRETFGLEKTFLGGDASVGLRLPVNTLDTDLQRTSVLSSAPNTTSVGDLSLILKAIICRTADDNGLLSAGLAITTPTGPDSFANDGYTRSHGTSFQPFLGYLWYYNNCFVQGFSSIERSTAGKESTVVFNDIGVGVFLFDAPGGDCVVTAVAPTVELHTTTPLTHVGEVSFGHPTRVPDLVDLTAGVNLTFCENTRLALGVVIPLTDPKPFNCEWIAQLRYRF